jgi:hypothetical protein
VPEAPDGAGGPPGPADGEPRRLWFARKDTGLGFGPVLWQGRAATYLYVLLVLVAVVTYSRLALTAFVIVFYTVVYGCVVIVKSDLLKEWPPGG